MAIDKSKWNTNIKVSQKTIDEIKKMGMNKALGTVAGASKAAGRDSSAAAWAEGVKRLYGANRVSAAVKAPAKKAAITGSSQARPANRVAPVAKPKAAPAPVKKTLANYNNETGKLPNNMSAAGKTKTPTKGLTPQKVAGTALTVAAMLATRGKVGRAFKVSPTTLAKAKAAPKAAAAKVTVGAKGSFGPTTKTMAKKGVGTPSEYASRAAQFGGPTNITIKKAAAKKAAAKKAKK